MVGGISEFGKIREVFANLLLGRSRIIVVPSFIDFTVILVIFGMMPILELP